MVQRNEKTEEVAVEQCTGNEIARISKIRIDFERAINRQQTISAPHVSLSLQSRWAFEFAAARRGWLRYLSYKLHGEASR